MKEWAENYIHFKHHVIQVKKIPNKKSLTNLENLKAFMDRNGLLLKATVTSIWLGTWEDQHNIASSWKGYHEGKEETWGVTR